jgi:hypothetical protein
VNLLETLTIGRLPDYCHFAGCHLAGEDRPRSCGSTQQSISLHLQNIYAEGELQREATHKEYLSVRQEGSRQVKRPLDFYNLDAIISVGYRVKSAVATRFRIWATQKLREYIVKGLVEQYLVFAEVLLQARTCRTRPTPELSTAEREEVKRVAHLLLEKLKRVMTFNWRQTIQSRARVRDAIEDVLDKELPRVYTPEIYKDKCSRLFAHIYETYTGGGATVFAQAE